MGHVTIGGDNNDLPSVLGRPWYQASDESIDKLPDAWLSMQWSRNRIDAKMAAEKLQQLLEEQIKFEPRRTPPWGEDQAMAVRLQS